MTFLEKSNNTIISNWILLRGRPPCYEMFTVRHNRLKSSCGRRGGVEWGGGAQEGGAGGVRMMMMMKRKCLNKERSKMMKRQRKERRKKMRKGRNEGWEKGEGGGEGGGGGGANSLDKVFHIIKHQRRKKSSVNPEWQNQLLIERGGWGFEE